MRELRQRKAIEPLLGLGCSPVLIRGNKPTFLKWISKAIRERSIHIPNENGSPSWQSTRAFLDRVNLQQSDKPRTPGDAAGCAG